MYKMYWVLRAKYRRISSFTERYYRRFFGNVSDKTQKWRAVFSLYRPFPHAQWPFRVILVDLWCSQVNVARIDHCMSYPERDSHSFDNAWLLSIKIWELLRKWIRDMTPTKKLLIKRNYSIILYLDDLQISHNQPTPKIEAKSEIPW